MSRSRTNRGPRRPQESPARQKTIAVESPVHGTQTVSWSSPTVIPKQGERETDTPPQPCAWDPSSFRPKDRSPKTFQVTDDGKGDRLNSADRRRPATLSSCPQSFPASQRSVRPGPGLPHKFISSKRRPASCPPTNVLSFSCSTTLGAIHHHRQGPVNSQAPTTRTTRPRPRAMHSASSSSADGAPGSEPSSRERPHCPHQRGPAC